MSINTIDCLGLIGLVSIFSQLIGWRFNIPSVLFLLLGGLLLGPITGLLKPDQLFQGLLFPIVSLAVAVILFEGGLTLKFADIAHLGRAFTRLITIGMLINLIGITLAVTYLFHISWEAALLFGAIMIVTGPTVIKPLLQAVRPQASIAHTLQWEGIILDPIGGILAILVLGFIISSHDSDALRHAAWYFIVMMGIGTISGIIQGYLLAEVIKRHWLPDYLLNVVTLVWVIVAYIGANELFDEMGLLVVTVMGMTVVNRKDVDIHSILEFKESMSTLLISALFIILAAKANLENMEKLLPASLALFLLMQFVIQPLKVFISFAGSSLNWRQKLLIAWISPRGIVAVALISLFTVELHQEGFDGANILPMITFFIIVFTVTWCSLTAKPLARWLGVAEPSPNGVLIVGANRVGRAIATALKQNGIQVIIADPSWENISAARMDGLSTYFGNPTSDVAEHELDLIGIGRLLAMSPSRQLNALASIRYGHIFGKNKIYYLQTNAEIQKSAKHLISERHKGSTLFNKHITFEAMEQYLANNASIRSTTLSQSFTLTNYLQTTKEHVVPLFVISAKHKLSVVVDGVIQAKEDDTILSLDFSAAESSIC